MSADQPYNARRRVELGAARTLDPVPATPEDVREAVSGVLADRAYRHAAERIQAEYNTLPGPDEAIALIERLAS
jgi:UDP:flavonoid glycosyltransferase YjiC (YdhE family)